MKQLKVRVNDALHARLVAEAEKHERSLNREIEVLLEIALAVGAPR